MQSLENHTASLSLLRWTETWSARLPTLPPTLMCSTKNFSKAALSRTPSVRGVERSTTKLRPVVSKNPNKTRGKVAYVDFFAFLAFFLLAPLLLLTGYRVGKKKEKKEMHRGYKKKERKRKSERSVIPKGTKGLRVPSWQQGPQRRQRRGQRQPTFLVQREKGKRDRATTTWLNFQNYPGKF